jgi:lipopolysaccharide export LptBFGC system permease protein LptF
MQESLKKFSPAVFGIILICFMLPWVNLSCQGQNAATFSGLQLVTGTTVQQQNQIVKSEPLAVAVLVLTILGLALSFLKDKKSSIIPGIIGVAAFILLLLLKSKIDTDASNQNIQVQYAIGFWLVLVLLIGAIALNGYLYFYSKKQV